jgi:hypothetical protein
MALMAVSFAVGCSMSNPTVRSQNPDLGGPIIGSAPGYGQLKNAPYLGHHGHDDFKPYTGAYDNKFGYEGGYYAGPNGYFTDRNLPYHGGAAYGCPDCCDGQQCPNGGCRRCGRGCGYRDGKPQHCQTYQYDWPQNMVYPQQGVPAGMIQYPYYTLRGPTDFFMK